jgi:uncharacterized membrane-anchored protein
VTGSWPEDRQRPFRRYRSKVPEVTVLFWFLAVLAAVAADPIADLLGSVLGLGITTTVLTTLLVVVLLAQVVTVRYVPWLYWLAVLLVSVFGILLGDDLVDIFDMSRAAAAIAFAVLLAATFVLWHTTERTLSIHTIDTPSREAFYWVAATFAFALGTAGLRMVTPGFRYGVIAITCAVLIVAAAAGHRFVHRGGLLSFWIGYVLTQPLGISTGDLLARPPYVGVTAVAAIIAGVTYLGVSHRDEPSLDNENRRVRARLK